MIEIALRKYMDANPVRAKIYYQAAPDNARLPFAVFTLQGRDEETPKGARGRVYSDFEFNCYGATAAQAIELGDLLAGMVRGYKGEMYGLNIIHSQIANVFDNDEPQTNSKVRTFTLLINHTRG